jgi:hypothetical protein
MIVGWENDGVVRGGYIVFSWEMQMICCFQTLDLGARLVNLV